MQELVTLRSPEGRDVLCLVLYSACVVVAVAAGTWNDDENDAVASVVVVCVTTGHLNHGICIHSQP